MNCGPFLAGFVADLRRWRGWRRPEGPTVARKLIRGDFEMFALRSLRWSTVVLVTVLGISVPFEVLQAQVLEEDCRRHLGPVVSSVLSD